MDATPLGDQSVYVRGRTNNDSQAKDTQGLAPVVVYGVPFQDPDVRQIQVETEAQLAELVAKIIHFGCSFVVERSKPGGISVKVCKEFTEQCLWSKQEWFSVDRTGRVGLIGTFATGHEAAQHLDRGGLDQKGAFVFDTKELQTLVASASRFLPPA